MDQRKGHLGSLDESCEPAAKLSAEVMGMAKAVGWLLAAHFALEACRCMTALAAVVLAINQHE